MKPYDYLIVRAAAYSEPYSLTKPIKPVENAL